MDPDTCLEEIRSLLNQILVTDEASEDDAIDLASRVNYLDQWLSKSGYLPADWQR